MLASIFDTLLNFWFLLVALLFLGLSIFVHELGHFLAARRRGLKVDRFSIGFGPRIFGWTGKDGVDYRLSAFPLGGYVALPQLADMGRLEGGEGESADNHPLPPISFADKMIVAVMGAVFNLIFALLLATVLWMTGQEVSTGMLTTEVGYVSPQVRTDDGDIVTGPAARAGIQPGDVILAVDGAEVERWTDVRFRVLAGVGRNEADQPETEIKLLRDDQVIQKTLNPVLVTSESIREVGLYPSSILYVDMLFEGLPAAEAGIRLGDRLVSLNGEPIRSLALVQDALLAYPEARHELTVERDGATFTYRLKPVMPEPGTTLTVRYADNGKTRTQEVTHPEGAAARPVFGFGVRTDTTTIYVNPVTQLADKMEIFYLTLRGLLHTDSDVKARNMSGPVGIVDNLQRTASYGWKELFWFVVFININLAILNLLPIPVLDGGHMLFATIAKIRGRSLPRRFMETTQAVFVLLLISFMLYVTFFDTGRVLNRIRGVEEEPVTVRPAPPPVDALPPPESPAPPGPARANPQP
ncbi:MAG: RIP metalloprotease RseP [Opitutales bacterium]